jgi:hypothetical protein
VRILGSVIQPLVRAVLDCRHDLARGSSVGVELVGDHAAWRAALLLQQAPQQAFGRFGIAPRLDDFVEDVSVLVNGSSEPIRLASERDHDLVEMPDVMAARRLAPEAASVRRPELPASSPDGLTGDDNAALEQHLLDQPQAQWKPEVQPDRMGNDLRRKAVAVAADRVAHAGPSTRAQSNPS